MTKFRHSVIFMLTMILSMAWWRNGWCPSSVYLRCWFKPPHAHSFFGSILAPYLLHLNGTVMTMSNSGPYPVTPVASQLYSSTPVAHHLLRSRSCRYTSVKYDPWSSPYSVLTTPHRLPCLDVSSPCTCYIHHFVSFSPDLVYFTRTWLYFTRTWLSTFSGYPLSAF